MEQTFSGDVNVALYAVHHMAQVNVFNELSDKALQCTCPTNNQHTVMWLLSTSTLVHIPAPSV